jgi:cytochrome b561
VRAANSDASWGWPARLLHWGMAALILFQLGLGVRSSHFTPDLLARFELVQTHKSWGAVILALALVRLGWRLANPTPRAPAGTPRWQVRAAAASHALLYALMIVLPVSGWVMASASPAQDLLGLENAVFGRLAMPDPWVPGSAAMEALARAVHVWSAVLLGIVLALHVAAALKHHLVDRDDVLARMSFRR